MISIQNNNTCFFTGGIITCIANHQLQLLIFHKLQVQNLIFENTADSSHLKITYDKMKWPLLYLISPRWFPFCKQKNCCCYVTHIIGYFTYLTKSISCNTPIYIILCILTSFLMVSVNCKTKLTDSYYLNHMHLKGML